MKKAGSRNTKSGLEEAGRWKLAELSEPFQPLPKGEPEVIHRIWAYQVTS